MSIKGGNGTFGGNYIAQTYISGNPKLSEFFIQSFIDSIKITDGDYIDISDATYTGKSFYFPHDSWGGGFTFGNNGTKAYFIASIAKVAYQYTLSTAYDISTASYDNVSISVDSGLSCKDVSFNPDGTLMYMIDRVNGIYVYELSVAWDLSTAVYSSVVDFAQTSYSNSFAFSEDGMMLFVSDDGSNTIYEYALSVAWDISTKAYTNKSIGVGFSLANIDFSSDGKNMFVVGDTLQTIRQYKLSNAWDFTGIAYSTDIDISGTVINPNSFKFDRSIDTRFYVMSGGETVFQYFVPKKRLLTFSVGKFFLDLSNIVDYLGKISNIVRKYVDNILIEDISNILKVFFQRFVDTIHVVDNFLSDLNQFFSVVWTEIIGVTDNYSKVFNKILYWMDHIDMSDYFEGLKIAFVNFVDSIVMSEAFAYLRTLGRVFVDAIHLADSSIKSIARTVSDGIAMAEVKIHSLVTSYIDSINISETIVKSVRIILTSAIGMVDTLARRLNGMLINWEKRFTDIKDWTKRVTQVVETTKVARVVSDWTKRSRNEESFTKTSKEEDTWTKFRGER